MCRTPLALFVVCLVFGILASQAHAAEVIKDGDTITIIRPGKPPMIIVKPAPPATKSK